MLDKSVDGWITIFRSGTDYEAELVRDRLVDSGIPAVVLTHRDHAFNLNVGDLARVRVLVSPEYRIAALRILHSESVSLEDLEAAALASDPTNVDDNLEEEEPD